MLSRLSVLRDAHATFVFNEINKVVKFGIERGHTLFDSLGVFLLGFGIALEQLDEAAHVVYLVILHCRVSLDSFDLLIDINSTETSLSDAL